MACGGIKHDNAASTIERTGVREIHVGLRSPVVSPVIGHDPRIWLVVDSSHFQDERFEGLLYW